MKGIVTEYSQEKQSGTIRAENGSTYAFSVKDCLRDFLPHEKLRLVFEPKAKKAVNIYKDVEKFDDIFSQKRRIIAVLLAFFLGRFGLHKFYLGYITQGIILLSISIVGWLFLFLPTGLVTLFTCIEGIVYVYRSDDNFYKRYVANHRHWF